MTGDIGCLTVGRSPSTPARPADTAGPGHGASRLAPASRTASKTIAIGQIPNATETAAHTAPTMPTTVNASGEIPRATAALTNTLSLLPYQGLSAYRPCMSVARDDDLRGVEPAAQFELDVRIGMRGQRFQRRGAVTPQ